MNESKDVVLAIFGGTLAIGGLVLFFLGMIANTLEKLRGAGTKAKFQYKLIGGIAYAAFLLSVACVALSSCWLLLGGSSSVYTFLVWIFMAQLALMAAAATLVFRKVATLK